MDDDFYCKMCGRMLDQGILCKSCEIKVKYWKEEDKRMKLKNKKKEEPQNGTDFTTTSI